jgi:hypothetical protein
LKDGGGPAMPEPHVLQYAMFCGAAERRPPELCRKRPKSRD